MNDGSRRWPRLSYADWSETALTLQLWTQIVGKVRLALTPWLNHSWHVPFYVTARGLGTTPIPAGDGSGSISGSRSAFVTFEDLLAERGIVISYETVRRCRTAIRS